MVHRLVSTLAEATKLSNIVSLFAEVDTQELVLATGVEKAVGDGREGAHLTGQDLRARVGLEFLRRGARAEQLALLRENQQLIARERDDCRADGIIFPTDVAGFKFHTAQAWPGLKAGIGASINAI